MFYCIMNITVAMTIAWALCVSSPEELVRNMNPVCCWKTVFQYSDSGYTRFRDNFTSFIIMCLRKLPSHTTETGENGSLPQEKPEAQQHLMPAAMEDKLIMRFRNEVGATNLEINKYLNIEEYGKH